LRDLSGAAISRWHSHLREHGGKDGKPLSSRTVAYSSRVLSMALGDAVESGLLASSPMSEIPKRQRATHRSVEDVGKVWDASQARTFLNVVQSDRLAALWALLLDSGCRRGEALGLQWSDLGADVVTFSHNRVIVGDHVEEGTLKNNKPRIVELHPATIAALHRHRKAQIAERLAAAAWTETNYIFVDELGQPLRPDSVSGRFERLVGGTDLPKISLHGLRHTSGTIALDNGTPLHIVASRLGHNPAVLLTVYAHRLPQSGRDAADRIGAAIYGT
jgi:integrase